MSNRTLAIRIAARYLWSRKSHSAVTAIAVAGVCGVALATMAIVCVLSVFNGFHDAILGRDSRITPQLLVQPAKGSLIADADSLERAIGAMEGVKAVTPAVTDEAVAYYEQHQLPVRILGVKPEAYRAITAIDSIMLTGKWKPQPQQVTDMAAEKELDQEAGADIAELADEEFDEEALFAEEVLSDEPEAQYELPVSPILASIGAASNLGLPSGADAGVLVFLPRRTGDINFADPATGFMIDSLAVTGVFSSEQADFDAATLIMDLETARRLLEYDTQANALYVGLDPGANPDRFRTTLSQRLGPDYEVKGRAEQQTLHFRMVAIEKWVTFLLLSFILVIASFNIISTLSMLIVEKRRNMLTMSAYGASRRFIGRVFFWESVMVCMAGSVAGIALGVALCALQMRFGFISVPGNTADMLLTSYPVRLNIFDLTVVFLLSAGIALLTGAISSAYASRTVSAKNK